MAANLTERAITRMCSESFTLDDEFKPVLQVIELTLLPSTRYRVSVSDGSYYHSDAIISLKMAELVQSGRLQKGSAVKLTHFVVNRYFDRKIILIFDLDVILDKCDLIGEPVPRLPRNCNCTTFCGWAFCGSNKLIPPAAADCKI